MCARACVRVHVCAILTRSRARAGVSVRLLFCVHPSGAWRDLASLRSCLFRSALSARFSFSQRTLRFAPRLILTLRAWPSACSNKSLFSKNFENWPKFLKTPPSGRLHTRDTRAYTTMCTCVCLCTQPRDVCVCGEPEGFNLKILLLKGVGFFSTKATFYCQIQVFS